MKLILIVLSLIKSGVSFSCQYNVNHFNYLKVNPERAALAAIVTVKVDHGKRFFAVDKAWTSSLKVYPLKDGDNCQVMAKENQSYLLLTELSTEKARSKKFKGFRQSGILLIDLKEARDLIKRLNQYKGTKLEIPEFGNN